MLSKWTPDARYRIHRMANLKLAFEFMRKEKIGMLNVSPEDIEASSTNALLSLIWNLIVRFQISKNDDVSPKVQTEKKKEILGWAQGIAMKYNVTVKDYTTSWQSGVALAIVVSTVLSEPVLIEKLDGSVAVKLWNEMMVVTRDRVGVPLVLSGEFFTVAPDESSMFCYLTYLYEKRGSDSVSDKNNGSSAVSTPEKKPLDVKVTVDPRKCTVTTGDTFLVGSIMNFTVTTLDTKSNQVYDKSTKIDFFVKDLNGSSKSMNVKEDKKDGIYLIEHTIGKSDTKIFVKVNGVEIYSISAPVKPKVDPFKCVISGQNAKFESGSLFILTLLTKDSTGALLDDNDLKVESEIRNVGKVLPSKVTKKDIATYLIEFTPAKGEHMIIVRVNGIDVLKNPLKLLAAPSLTEKVIVPTSVTSFDLSKIKVSGPGLMKAVAGEESVFSIDLNGIANDSTKVTISFSPEVGFDLEKIDTNHFECKYRPDVPGEVAIILKVDGKTVFTSPTIVRIEAEDSCDPTVSEVLKKEHYEVFANSSFQILSKASDGTLRIGKNDDFDVTLIPEEGDYIYPTIKNNGDGSYTCQFVSQIVGQYKVVVTHKEMKIAKTPFFINFLSPLYYAVGLGLKDGVKERKRSSFDVRRRSGVSDLLRDFKIRVETPSKIETTTTNVSHPEDGIVHVEYTPKEPGKHLLHVIINDEDVAGSPFLVDVAPYVPPKVDPSKSIAQGEGVNSKIKIGNRVHFTITCVDTDGEIREHNDDKIEVNIIYNNALIEAKIQNNNNGTYTVSYIPQRDGIYTLDIKIDGQEIMNSPFSAEAITIESAECWKVTEPKDLINNVCSFIVAPIEENSPRPQRIQEPEDIEIVLKHGDSDKDTLVKQIRRTDQGYVVYLNPTHTGEHEFRVLFDGKDVGGSPFVAMISEGCDPSKCVIESFPEKIDVFEALKFSIYSKNKKGAVRKTEVDNFTVLILGPEQDLLVGEGLGIFPVKPKKSPSGSYDVEFTPKIAGKYQVEVSIYDQMFWSKEIEVVPPAWYAHGRGLKQNIPAGKKTFFYVERLSPIEEKVKDFKCGISAPKKSKNCDMDISNETPGIIMVEYVPKEEGEHAFAIQINGKEIKGSPFVVLVKKDGADPKRCFVTDRNVDIRVGELTKIFTIHSIDREEIQRITSDDDFLVLMQEPTDHLMKAHVINNHDGTYDVFYTPRFEGEHRAEVILDGEPILHSPFNFYSKAPLWTIVEESLSFFEKQTTTVHVKKNSPLQTEQTLTVTLTTPKQIILPLVVSMTEKNTFPTYEFSVTPEIFGTYNLSICADGEEIPTSPFSFDVLPRCDPSKSYAEGPFNQVVDLEFVTIKIFTRDSLGNARVGVQGPEIKVTPTPIKCRVQDTEDGLYQVVFTPSKKGKHVVSIKVDGKDVQGSPYTITLLEKTKESLIEYEKKQLEIKRQTAKAKIFKLVEKKKSSQRDIVTYTEKAEKLLQWIDASIKKLTISNESEFGNNFLSCSERFKMFTQFKSETLIMKKEKVALNHLYSNFIFNQQSLSLKPFDELPFSKVQDAWGKLDARITQYETGLNNRFNAVKKIELEVTSFRLFQVEMDGLFKTDFRVEKMDELTMDRLHQELRKINSWKVKFKLALKNLEHFIGISKEMDQIAHKDSIEFLIKTNDMNKRMVVLRDSSDKKVKELEKAISLKMKEEETISKVSSLIVEVDRVFEKVMSILRIHPIDETLFLEAIDKLKAGKQKLPELTTLWTSLRGDFLLHSSLTFERLTFKLEWIEERIGDIGLEIDQQKDIVAREKIDVDLFETGFGEYKEWIQDQTQFLTSHFVKDLNHEALLREFEDDVIPRLIENSSRYKHVCELFSRLVNKKVEHHTKVTFRVLEQMDAQFKEQVILIERMLRRGLEHAEDQFKTLDIALDEIQDWIDLKSSHFALDLSDLLSIASINVIQGHLKSIELFKVELDLAEADIEDMKQLATRVLNYRHSGSERIYQDALLCLTAFEKLKVDIQKTSKDLLQILSLMQVLEKDAIEYATKTQQVSDILTKYKNYLDTIKNHVGFTDLSEKEAILETHHKMSAQYPTQTIEEIQGLWNKMFNAGEDPCMFTEINLQMILALSHEVKIALESNIELFAYESEKKRKQDELIEKFTIFCIEFIELTKLHKSLGELEEKKNSIFEIYDLLFHNKLVDQLDIDKSTIQQIYDHVQDSLKEYPVFQSYDVLGTGTLNQEQATRAANDLEKILDRKQVENIKYEDFIVSLKDTNQSDLKSLMETILSGNSIISPEDQLKIELGKNKDGSWDISTFITNYFK